MPVFLNNVVVVNTGVLMSLGPYLLISYHQGVGFSARTLPYLSFPSLFSLFPSSCVKLYSQITIYYVYANTVHRELHSTIIFPFLSPEARGDLFVS